MVSKWCLAVSRLVTRKEQQIPPYEVYFRNQRVEEVQYNKFGQSKLKQIWTFLKNESLVLKPPYAIVFFKEQKTVMT